MSAWSMSDRTARWAAAGLLALAWVLLSTAVVGQGFGGAQGGGSTQLPPALTSDGRLMVHDVTPSAVTLSATEVDVREWAGAAAAGGAGTATAGSPRVVLSSDSSGSLNLTSVAGSAITAGAGAVAAGTARMTLASDDPAVAALQIVDDWDEGDRAKVNIVVGQAGVAAGTGTDSASALRVTLATDVALPAGGNRIGTVDASIMVAGLHVSGANPVPANATIVAALPAGDNNIGNVDLASAIPAGGNRIGGVDATIIAALPAGTNNIGDVDIASLPAGAAVDVTRIIQALPAGTNLLGSVNLGVAADVTEVSSAAIAASLSVLDDWDESNRAAVNLISGQAGVAAGAGITGANVLRVVLSSDSSGSLAITTFPDNEPFNLAQIAGASTLTGTGASAGALRVVTSADSTLTVTQAGNVSIGTFPDNEPINVAQMNGVAVTMGSGVVGTGVQRVSVATDDVVSVDDNAGSLTVDAPVGTPVAARLSDGAAFYDSTNPLPVRTPSASFTTSSAQITSDVSLVAAAANLRYMGFSVREDAGTAAVATVIVRHGTLDSDPIVDLIELAPNESAREWYWPGIAMPNGIFIDVVAGSVTISVRHATAQ